MRLMWCMVCCWRGYSYRTYAPFMQGDRLFAPCLATSMCSAPACVACSRVRQDCSARFKRFPIMSRHPSGLMLEICHQDRHCERLLWSSTNADTHPNGKVVAQLWLVDDHACCTVLEGDSSRCDHIQQLGSMQVAALRLLAEVMKKKGCDELCTNCQERLSQGQIA